MKKRGLRLPKQRTIQAPALIWKRVLALIIDLLTINLVVLYPFKKLFNKIVPKESYKTAIEFLMQSPETVNLIFTITIFITILVLMYFTVLEFRLRQTLGMMLLNIYVKSEKEKLTFFQVLISNITFIPLFPIFPFLWIIDPIVMIFSKKSQRLMQKITHILVVEEYKMD